jgi:hypothetical protein
VHGKAEKGIQIEGCPSFRQRQRTSDSADDGKRAERSAHVSKPLIINIILGPTIVPHEGIETQKWMELLVQYLSETWSEANKDS